jgi:hypothetical protein
VEADTVITVPGAHFSATSLWPEQDPAQLGTGWYDEPGIVPQVLAYDRSPVRDVDGHVAGGQVALDAQIKAAYLADPSGTITIVSASMGTLVSQAEQRSLASDPAAPPADQVVFVETSSPTRPSGAARYFPVGVRLPGVGYTVTRDPMSQYDVDVVVGEYDWFGDAPDRPWNLLADANAAMGLLYVHGQTSTDSQRADARVLSTVTNTLGGTTTTYLVPTKQLPLTQPLRQAGVPDRVVDRIDKPLRRVIDRAYKRNDDDRRHLPGHRHAA